jgi:hypothetical protein
VVPYLKRQVAASLPLIAAHGDRLQDLGVVGVDTEDVRASSAMQRSARYGAGKVRENVPAEFCKIQIVPVPGRYNARWSSLPLPP